jgi:hypothetical protein
MISLTSSHTIAIAGCPKKTSAKVNQAEPREQSLWVLLANGRRLPLAEKR